MQNAIETHIRALAQAVKRNIYQVMALAIFLSFAVSFALLYYIHPSSFEPTWTGSWERRIYLVFFLWLGTLETILNWEELHIETRQLRGVRVLIFTLALSLPIMYVVVANYFGLNQLIIDTMRQQGVHTEWAELMPLSLEYLIFAVFFVFLTFLKEGGRGLRNYFISTSFLVVVGTIYTINNIFPFGRFTPFQILVHPTATLAANVLNLFGFSTSMRSIESHPTFGSLTTLSVTDADGNSATFGIAWPCAGVESLLIYAVTIALFLKKSAIPPKQKAAYFIIGAVVTYFINILRIVTIFTIAIGNGDVGIFHDFYGQLFSIFWIISYPLIIVGTRAFWNEVIRGKIVPEYLTQPN